MLPEHIAFKFLETLVSNSERKTLEIHELLVRPSKVCGVKFTLNLTKNLELSPEVLLIALLIARRAVDKNLKIEKKNLYRFCCFYID